MAKRTRLNFRTKMIIVFTTLTLLLVPSVSFAISYLDFVKEVQKRFDVYVYFDKDNKVNINELISKKNIYSFSATRGAEINLKDVKGSAQALEEEYGTKEAKAKANELTKLASPLKSSDINKFSLSSEETNITGIQAIRLVTSKIADIVNNNRYEKKMPGKDRRTVDKMIRNLAKVTGVSKKEIEKEVVQKTTNLGGNGNTEISVADVSEDIDAFNKFGLNLGMEVIGQIGTTDNGQNIYTYVVRSESVALEAIGGNFNNSKLLELYNILSAETGSDGVTSEKNLFAVLVQKDDKDRPFDKMINMNEEVENSIDNDESEGNNENNNNENNNNDGVN